METVYLSRRNLLTLLAKLDARKAGEHDRECLIIKRDNKHKTYPQTMPQIIVKALEDEEYYTDRSPGYPSPELYQKE
jgi:hypothetical protein